MECERCHIREESVTLGSPSGTVPPQHLCEECAIEVSPEYAEFTRKSALADAGELLCEMCGQQPARHFTAIGTEGGFWCPTCVRSRPLPEELRQALAAEAAKVGLSEAQLRQGLEEIGQRLLDGGLEPPSKEG
jgi:protein-arginine kinase activator protein McsA